MEAVTGIVLLLTVVAAVAIVAIQKRDRNSPMPLGKERALEKPRLVLALSNGSREKPNHGCRVQAAGCSRPGFPHSMQLHAAVRGGGEVKSLEASSPRPGARTSTTFSWRGIC